MNAVCTQRDGMRLFLEGQKALSDVEHHGICVDVSYCKKQTINLLKIVKKLKVQIEDDPQVKEWKRSVGAIGGTFKISSNTQLHAFLYKKLGLKPRNPEQPKVEEEDLAFLKLPWLNSLLRVRKIEKVIGRLEEILREQVGGVLHPFFNLHLVRTFRSSSDHINFQNQNVRNPEFAEILRMVFIPRKPTHCLMELDYKGIEVCVSACNHQDPKMISYIKDKSKDMHRDLAMECFKLPRDQVTKETRYCGKNMFVFPQFYGDYYINCAKSLWEAKDSMLLERVDGLSLTAHLAEQEQGIHSYQEFEAHIKQVEHRFWYRYFNAYREWKEQFYHDYLRQGYFNTLTGFRCSGPMRRNEVLNYPIQGPAFHCLLWSLIRANKTLKKTLPKCWIVGQIHDSMVLDLPAESCQEVQEVMRDIMTVQIIKAWPWIIVPLEIEIERTEPGQAWWFKKGV